MSNSLIKYTNETALLLTVEQVPNPVFPTRAMCVVPAPDDDLPCPGSRPERAGDRRNRHSSRRKDFDAPQAHEHSLLNTAAPMPGLPCAVE